jgi:hypothetical protein
MSGDMAADPSEPRKELGLIWETQQDRLQEDVKLNPILTDRGWI